eukprot:jgi/Picre1/27332/NNA_000301.t1
MGCGDSGEQGKKHASPSSGPDLATQAVLVPSEELPADSVPIRGHDFNHGRDIDGIWSLSRERDSKRRRFGRAVDEVNSMLDWKVPESEVDEEDGGLRRDRCKIFLGILRILCLLEFERILVPGGAWYGGCAGDDSWWGGRGYH